MRSDKQIHPFNQEDEETLNIDTYGAAADLRKLAEQIENTHSLDGIQCEFRLEDLHDNDAMIDMVDHIFQWEKQVQDARYLYSFTLPSAELAIRCRDAVARTRVPERNTENCRFSRVNGDQEGSCCLYVGSSRSLATRLKQHLGLAYRGTYAMQMMHWQPEQSLEGRVYFDVTRFGAGIEATVLQALEDKLWQSERPLLGRMGAR